MRVLADWLIGLPERALPALHLAGALVCADYRGLGVPVEWLGQAQQFAAGHREFRGVGHSVPAILHPADLGN